METLPIKSIALDGIVPGSTIDPFLEKYSFDHHYKNIPRLAQSSTVKQIYDSIMLGWKPPTKNGYTWVYFADVDLDCMLSIFLLTLTKKHIDKRLKEWVEVVNSVDVFGPAYIFNDERSEKIKDFLYYRILRKHKGKSSVSIISSILDNIEYYFKRDSINYTYHNKKTRKLVVLEQCNFIHPQHPMRDINLMAIMSEDPVFDYGYKKGADLVVGIRQKSNNTYKYSVAVKNDFIPYSITQLLNTVSEREPGWGGGSTIIGSPESGSNIAPHDLLYLIKRGQWNEKHNIHTKQTVTNSDKTTASHRHKHNSRNNRKRKKRN